jgi:hypothetical protein
MNKSKYPAYLWTIAGIILSLLTLTVTVCGINSTPVIAMDASVAVEAAEQTLDCARTGDYDALGQMLYGAPKLGDSPMDEDDLESTILLAFLDSIQYQVSSECRTSDSGISVDVKLTCLDLAAVSESLQAIVPGLMNRIANEKGDESLVYDAGRNYREDFITEVLTTATQQVLEQAPQTVDREITLELVQSGGRWQVVPTEAFIQLLSGYVSE